MQNPSVVEAFGRLVAQGTDAAGIGDLFAAAWKDIDTSLSRVVGVHGAAALSKHCLMRATAHHPWLEVRTSGEGPDIDASSLRSILCLQRPEAAAAAAGEILETLASLLIQMIGSSLTHELLGAAWQHILDERNP